MLNCRDQGPTPNRALEPDALSIIMSLDLPAPGWLLWINDAERAWEPQAFVWSEALRQLYISHGTATENCADTCRVLSRLLTIFLLDTVAAVLIGTAVSKLALLRDRTLPTLAVGLECGGGFLRLVVLAILSSTGVVTGAGCIIWSLVAELSNLAAFKLKSVLIDNGVDLSRPVWRALCQ